MDWFRWMDVDGCMDVCTRHHHWILWGVDPELGYVSEPQVSDKSVATRTTTGLRGFLLSVGSADSHAEPGLPRLGLVAAGRVCLLAAFILLLHHAARVWQKHGERRSVKVGSPEDRNQQTLWKITHQVGFHWKDPCWRPRRSSNGKWNLDHITHRKAFLLPPSTALVSSFTCRRACSRSASQSLR